MGNRAEGLRPEDPQDLAPDRFITRSPPKEITAVGAGGGRSQQVGEQLAETVPKLGARSSQ
jgi:hypothetical protein